MIGAISDKVKEVSRKRGYAYSPIGGVKVPLNRNNSFSWNSLLRNNPFIYNDTQGAFNQYNNAGGNPFNSFGYNYSDLSNATNYDISNYANLIGANSVDTSKWSNPNHYMTGNYGSIFDALTKK